MIKKTVKNIFLILIVSLFFISCSSNNQNVKSAFQTNSATIVDKDVKSLLQKLEKLKIKLDKRNPKNYSKNNEKRIFKLLKDGDGTLVLKYDNRVIRNYKEYLELAFTKENIDNRNDFLILGIYYGIYEAYTLNKTHKFVAFEHKKKELLQKLQKNLQVLKWKIKFDKDTKDNYLFLTWQKNWQIELENIKKSKGSFSIEDIKNLKYIKEKQETIFEPSNFSFEVLLSSMIENVQNSLKALGDEPTELTFKALFLFI